MHVELALSAHTEKNQPGLQRFADKLDGIYSVTNGPIYVVLENSGIDRESAIALEYFVAHGIPPLVSFAFSFFPANQETVSILSNARYDGPAREAVLNLIGRAHTHSELAVLDEIFDRYRDGDGNSRLKLISESKDSSIFYTDETIVLDELNAAFDFLKRGDFSSSLTQYRDTVTRLAEESKVREETIAKRIAEIEDPDGSYVVVKFGTAHTGIRHELQRWPDMEVSTTFLDKPEDVSTYWFSSFDSAVRKCRFFGAASVTDLEWYQSMLGHAFNNILSTLIESSTDEVPIPSEQEKVAASIDFAQTFTSLDLVEQFRQKVEDTDIGEALMMWMELYPTGPKNLTYQLSS